MAVAAAVRHFERAAGEYSRLRASGPLGAIRRGEQAALRALAPVGAGEWVLDVGCGDGETLLWLDAAGARGLGLDAAFAMAASCRRRGFAVCVQDMERLGVRAVFDWVLCVGSLEFTAEPARALSEMAAVLRPRGRLVLLFPRRAPLGALYAGYHRAHGVRIHLFSRAEVSRLLSAAGFDAPVQWRDEALSSLCVAERRV